MVELAEIIRAAGPACVQGRGLRPAQQRALRDIVQCRTPALGGSLYRCDACGTLEYRYHSCRNRHCPKCQEDRAQDWLARTRARLLPCDHYLLTFTLPASLRAVAQAHPQIVYAALLRAAAAAVQTLAADRTWVGGTLGILAVLHTWSRTLAYHPHAHLLVTAGGLAPDGTTWVQPAHPRFLCPGCGRARPSAIARIEFNTRFCRGSARQESLLRYAAAVRGHGPTYLISTWRPISAKSSRFIVMIVAPSSRADAAISTS